ncbi:MAG: S9 family peptidase, partial [Candidatus Korarchaeota archaeon]|nr:S9 family peptidase [Candidatus Korarchaeota archaeon]NIU84641.1 S9 family peptidase [Candidatus Thorarchaeota archaeon]NIW14667.1 S9 family peptidase [Candidatus Thorarchaeota archaeon]NIW52743.1 S9 family peptidase [Candidatus Korarchaeota archaeon]
FSTNEEGKITLAALRDDEKTSIVDENAWVTSFDVSDNGRIAFLLQNDTQLNEVYLWDTQVTKITDYNTPIIKKLDVRPLHHFSFESLDLEID